MKWTYVIVTMSDNFLLKTPTYNDELKQIIIAKLKEKG